MEVYSFSLKNGLEVVFGKVKSPIVAVNVLYKVGSRDEDPQKTGYAHLLEHLMFEGSKNIKAFDRELELAGGTNNAFTNKDFTSYYMVLPKENIETALWLESDRMLALDFSVEKLEIQKNVVIEEFKENYLNKPYGDDMKYVYYLAYEKHPYQWQTIGKCVEQLQNATLEDVMEFYYKFYAPNNAILSIVGDFNFDEIKFLVEKWFSDIPKRALGKKNLPKEPPQLSRRQITIVRDVPAEYIYLAFHYSDRLDFGYYTADLITDILSSGKNSLFYKNLYKKGIVSDIDAFITATLDLGLIVIYASPSEKYNIFDLENIIWEQLQLLYNQEFSQLGELLKIVKNNSVYQYYSGTQTVLRKALLLAYYKMLGDENLFFTDIENYQKITVQDIRDYSKEFFKPQKVSVVYYKNQPFKNPSDTHKEIEQC